MKKLIDGIYNHYCLIALPIMILINWFIWANFGDYTDFERIVGFGICSMISYFFVSVVNMDEIKNSKKDNE